MKPMQYVISMVGSNTAPTSGFDIVNYFRSQLGKNPQSAGASISRALEYGFIRIVGTIIIGNKEYNLYR